MKKWLELTKSKFFGFFYPFVLFFSFWALMGKHKIRNLKAKVADLNKFDSLIWTKSNIFGVLFLLATSIAYSDLSCGSQQVRIKNRKCSRMGKASLYRLHLYRLGQDICIGCLYFFPSLYTFINLSPFVSAQT